MANIPELIHKTAVEIIALLRTGQVTPHDCLDTLEARIAAVDGPINALPTLCFERARRAADVLLKKRPAERGLLAGMPVPIKDLAEVAGVRTTFGSPVFADHISKRSDPMVERIEAEGGLIYAKANTPEFGSGANTFNDVLGTTRNPWNTTHTVAGSSGGSAAALASGTAWIAHGSDLGGSLRTPASFNSVVGLRPSPGRVPTPAGYPVDQQLFVEGPMARNIEDVALFLDALTTEDIRDPVSLPSPTASFLSGARSGWKPKRIAFSADLGITPVDPEVAVICRKAAYRFADAGVIVEEAHPDFSEMHDTFGVLRARGYAISKMELLRTHRDRLKPEIIWNAERGLALTMADQERAERQRLALYQRTLAFFDTYDLICTPAAIVAPFPVENRYVKSCNGVEFDNYTLWFAISYAFSTVNCTSLSLPCGFTSENLPVGLQIVARPRAESRLLAGAKLLEDLLGLKHLTPIEPRIRHLQGTAA